MAGQRGESGFGLLEVLIASALSLVIMIGAFEFLNSSVQTAAAVGRRSVNSANAREAIDVLEANLRYATGINLCAGSPTTTPCSTTLSAPSTPSAWSRTGSATLFVSNATGGTQPACDEWTITPVGLQEQEYNTSVSAGVVTLFTIPKVMAWVPPAATAVAPNSTAQSTGFSYSPSTTPGLVVIDLLVNSAADPHGTTSTAVQFDTADAVSVHDFISTDDLGSQGALTPVPGAC